MSNVPAEASYADLTMGFVSGINSIAPLIPAFAPDIKMTVKVVLEDVGRAAFIDLTSRPPKVDFENTDRDAGVIFWTNSKDFHEILRGKLHPIKAWNDKRALVEMTPSALAGLPVRKPAGTDSPTMVPGFMYELYLVSIGAGKAIENGSSSGTVKLEPQSGGVVSVIARGFAWFFGLVFGLLFRLVLKRLMKPPDPDKPPKIEWHEVDDLPRPGKPFELGRISGAVLRWIFRRVDMFTLANSFVNGAKVGGIAS